jgi:hypothetical protein
MPEWKAAKPFTYMLNEEAHAIICLLRLDEGGRDRAHFCPEIKEWSKQTGADEILVAMFHKLQGELARVRKAPIQTGTRTEKGASCFTIKRAVGRPCKEAAIADAAAKLVGRSWRAYKQRAAKAQRSAEARTAARTARVKVGTFTARGNAVTQGKAAAIVQVCELPARLAPAPRVARASI